MPDQITTMMVLKADLQCSKCFKKVKKVVGKFPQIQDQIYDEKQNTVTIKVVYCCPEKIRDKIIRESDGVIKSIEIKMPEKKKKEPEKPKEPEKKKEEPEKPKEPVKMKDPEKKKEADHGDKADKSKVDPPRAKELVASGYPSQYYPFGVACLECYGGGPSYPVAPPPQIWYDGYYGRPVYDSWAGGGYGSRHYGYHPDSLSEENPSACTIM